MGEKSYTAKYLVKTLILVILLGIESYFLADYIHDYANTGNFLEIRAMQIVPVIVCMLAVIYTYALTVGAWEQHEQFVVVPIPLAVGVFLRAYMENPQYAVTMSLFVFLLSTYDIYLATRLKGLLIRFDPVLILRLSAKGILLAYCFVGAFFVMYSTPQGEDFDIVSRVGEITSSKLDDFLKPELSNNPVPESILNLFSSIDPRQTSISLNPATIQLNIKESVNEKVNSIITPYVHLIKPLMSLVVFGILQFMAFLAILIFTFTVKPIFFIARKAKFFETVLEDVKRETLKF